MSRSDRLRRQPLNSVRNRLVLLFFAITAAAIAFVYLYVVPQLRSSLTAEELVRLEELGAAAVEPLERAMDAGARTPELRALLRRHAQDSNARVTLLGIREGDAGPEPRFVIADSEFERDAVAPEYLPAVTAAGADRIASGIELVAGERLAETAVPVTSGGDTPWVAVFSRPLDDVDDNVALIRRQILIAGTIALVAAALAGWLAARAHSRRLRRLETAAEQVAEGNFDVPIPIDSTDEVGQLAMTFDEMQKRLARLDSARKEFIANASHELRTPIFSLGGFVELLDEENPDPESRREFVRTMREQIDRLTKLATDLLDLSKLDADAIELSHRDVDLARVARETAAEFQPAADRHGSRLEVRADSGGPVVALADPDRVRQIMRILVDNALKHTPEGTSITVRTHQQDGVAGLVVSDVGPGIAAQARTRVFDRFYTGDEAGGSGLGLAIARELAMRMNGDLEVASRAGRTDFTLELPAAGARA
jgi:two-component system OmpR family sensor kinase